MTGVIEQDERIKGLEIGENEIILKQETTIKRKRRIERWFTRV